MQPRASIVVGPYQLFERIGAGGGGQVHRAEGPSGAVAIKILAPSSELDDSARARFQREIATLDALVHPNLVRLLDHGVDDELGVYLVLPLLAGATLRDLVGGRAICPEAALLLALPIVEATAALHAAGFVHRDLKPENAIASPDGTITVIDLGLAWREGMTRHTETGAAVGSVGYMSPEQIDGRRVDGRADVWALGVMIYEWIAGTRPFQRARPTEEAAAVVLGAFSALPAADRRASGELGELVGSCLAADPAKRPTAEALASALRAMIDWARADRLAAETIAVIADPVAYQARVAPFRVRRVERLAREALDAGKPFAVLAHCDRGLAYEPDNDALAALVAEAERATAAIAHVETEIAPATRSRRRKLIIAACAVAVVGAVVAVNLRGRGQPTRDPWADPVPSDNAPPQPTVTVTQSGSVDVETLRSFAGVFDKAASSPKLKMDPGDRALVKGFVTVFDKILDKAEPVAPREAAPPPAAEPTTAAGWLQLAGTQSTSDAIASIRRALAIEPASADVHAALCAALAATWDDGAIAACDTAIALRDQLALHAARGAARLHAGQAAAALADLDLVVAGDRDPRWRRLRARAKQALGDKAGADRDLADACWSGDSLACRGK